jgi:hypothetical protein
MDEIVEYYKEKLSNWDYYGYGMTSQSGVEGATWRHNDYLLNIYYLSLPDKGAHYLLLRLTRFNKPIYGYAFFWIITTFIIIVFVPTIIIYRKFRKKAMLSLIPNLP